MGIRTRQAIILRHRMFRWQDIAISMFAAACFGHRWLATVLHDKNRYSVLPSSNSTCSGNNVTLHPMKCSRDGTKKPVSCGARGKCLSKWRWFKNIWQKTIGKCLRRRWYEFIYGAFRICRESCGCRDYVTRCGEGARILTGILVGFEFSRWCDKNFPLLQSFGLQQL